jgi:hypothetical protein
VDEQLNPVSLRITYEVDQGGTAFWVVGADGQFKIGKGFEIGGSAVTDRNPLAPYDLYSANAVWRLAERTALVVEAAQSSSTVNTNPSNQSATPALAGRVGEVKGSAVRAELAHQGERTEARLFYGRSSPLFNNPAAPLNGGRGEINAKGSFKLTEDLKLYAEGLKSEDRNTGGGERSQAGLGLRWTASDRLTLDASIRAARETVGTVPNGSLSWPYDQTLGLSSSIGSGSGGGALGFGNQVLDPATGIPVIQQGGLPGATTSLAAGTELSSDLLRVGAGFRVTDRFSLGAEAEADVSGDRRRRVALGGDYTVAERTRLYGRYEVQDGWVQMGGVSDTGRNAHGFVFGVDSSYLTDTQLFSEYRLRDAIAGRDLQLASGVRNNWNVAEGWRISTAVENLRVISGSTGNVNAISLGLDWTADPLWRASTRVEWRRSGDVSGTPENDRFDTTLVQALVARKLDRDWTLLARNHLLKTDYAARGGVLQDRAQVGLAYRDTDTNRSNALAKLEYKTERDASNATVGELKSRAWIASLHGDYHPSRAWWVTGRVAGKWQKDQLEAGVDSNFRAQLWPHAWSTTSPKTGMSACWAPCSAGRAVHANMPWAWRWATCCNRTCGCQPGSTPAALPPTPTWRATSTRAAAFISACVSSSTKTSSRAVTRRSTGASTDDSNPHPGLGHHPGPGQPDAVRADRDHAHTAQGPHQRCGHPGRPPVLRSAAGAYQGLE